MLEKYNKPVTNDDALQLMMKDGATGSASQLPSAVGGASTCDSTATTASADAAVRPCVSERRLACVLVLST